MSTLRARDVAAILAAFAATLVGLAAFVLVGAPTGTNITPGYTWTAAAVGIDPAGLKVYVVRGSRTADVASATEFAVAQQRRYGIRVSWAGYTTNRSTRKGVIVVYQGGQCHGAAAAGYDRQVPSDTPYVAEVVAGAVAICGEAAFDNGRVGIREILLHEMGHVLGLEHYLHRFQGRLQIMYPTMQEQYQTYQAGDVAGLRAIVANTMRLANADA